MDPWPRPSRFARTPSLPRRAGQTGRQASGTACTSSEAGREGFSGHAGWAAGGQGSGYRGHRGLQGHRRRRAVSASGEPPRGGGPAVPGALRRLRGRARGARPPLAGGRGIDGRRPRGAAQLPERNRALGPHSLASRPSHHGSYPQAHRGSGGPPSPQDAPADVAPGAAHHHRPPGTARLRGGRPRRRGASRAQRGPLPAPDIDHRDRTLLSLLPRPARRSGAERSAPRRRCPSLPARGRVLRAPAGSPASLAGVQREGGGAPGRLLVAAGQARGRDRRLGRPRHPRPLRDRSRTRCGPPGGEDRDHEDHQTRPAHPAPRGGGAAGSQYCSARRRRGASGPPRGTAASSATGSRSGGCARA